MRHLIFVWLFVLCFGALDSAQAQKVPSSGMQVDRRFDNFPGVLPKSVVPTLVNVHFELDPDASTFSGKATYTLFVREAVSEIVMHSRGLAVTDVSIADNPVPPLVVEERDNDLVRFKLFAPLQMGTRQLSLSFSGGITESGVGLYRAKMRDGSTVRNMLATQNQPIGARMMVPCFDEPTFRTKWEVSITAPNKYVALSNAQALAAVPVSDTHVKTSFIATPSMSSYLLAVAVGEFDKLEEEMSGVRFAIYTPPGKAKLARQAMQWTQTIFTHLQHYFGVPYPLRKLDQLVVPGKNGAMENWGLITYAEDLLLLEHESASRDQKYYAFNVIAHELAHQWFGNLVTMAWWDDLWLNESFASWIAHKTTRVLMPHWETENRSVRDRERAMAIDALLSAQSIERKVGRDTQALDAFDAITYEKGHAVLDMVEAYAGEEPWQRAIQEYMRKHQFGVTRASDIWFEVDLSAQREIRRFARTWTEQPHYPIVDVTATCSNGKQTLTLKQSPVSVLGKPNVGSLQRWRLAIPVQMVPAQDLGSSAVRPRTQLIRMDRDTVNWDAGDCALLPALDPLGSSYMRFRYDSALSERLIAALVRLPVPTQQRFFADALGTALEGGAGLKSLFSVARSLSIRHRAETWEAALDSFNELLTLTQGDALGESVRKQVRDVVNPMLASVSWSPRDTDSENTRRLRASLIETAVRAGDADALRQARALFDQRATTPKVLEGDVGGAIITAVGLKARRQDVDAIAAIIRSGNTFGQAWVLNRALTSTDDPAVAQHVATLSLSNDLPHSATSRVLRNLAANGHGDKVLEFVEKNLGPLTAKYSLWARRNFFAAALTRGRDLSLAQRALAAARGALPPEELAETNKAVALVERNAALLRAVRAQFAP